MPNLLAHPEKLFQSFENQCVMVVGDIMLDRYVTGAANRLSPEAPVPILEVATVENRLGGAANVALNLMALGAKPLLCGLIGNDSDSEIFIEVLQKSGVQSGGIIASPQRPTTVKTRIVAGKQQLLRLDRETTADLSPEEALSLLDAATAMLDSQEVKALIFQDYNKGVLTPAVISTLTAVAKQKGILIAVDPKFRNFWNYTGADLFKPNLKEIRDALQNNLPKNEAALRTAAAQVRQRLGCRNVLITLSELGVFMDDGVDSKLIPTRPRNVADVSGAGDTVISLATLALLAGLPADQIALLANLAGGQVVEKAGVVTLDRDALLHELRQLQNQ